MKFIISLTILLFTWFAIMPLEVIAQEKVSKLHPTDDPHKYKDDFEGIGPSVYIIPPPKTDEELLIEKYASKKENQHQIDSLLVNLNLKKELKRIKTYPIFSFFKDSLKNEDEEDHLIAVANYYKSERNENYYADWQNNLAVFYLLSGESDKANTLLLESLKIKERLGAVEDQLLVLSNLALLEAQVGNNIKALSLYDQLLEQAKKTKNIDNQAKSYLAMAKLKAHQGDYVEAHNLVIKKSMPLLQRIKNYSEYRRFLLWNR